jgi:hypothetical protein
VGLTPVVKSVVTFQNQDPQKKTSKGSNLYLAKSSKLILTKGSNMIIGGCMPKATPTQIVDFREPAKFGGVHNDGSILIDAAHRETIAKIMRRATNKIRGEDGFANSRR